VRGKKGEDLIGKRVRGVRKKVKVMEEG